MQMHLRESPAGVRRHKSCALSLEDDLAAEFAAERLRREMQTTGQVESTSAPFDGIKEIVLDDSGRPTSIPRRPPPSPGITAQGEIQELLYSPSFLFGSIAAVASALILLAIFQADMDAS